MSHLTPYKNAIDLLRSAEGDLHASAEHYRDHGSKSCADNREKLAMHIHSFLRSICICREARLDSNCVVHASAWNCEKDLRARENNFKEEFIESVMDSVLHAEGKTKVDIQEEDSDKTFKKNILDCLFVMQSTLNQLTEGKCIDMNPDIKKMKKYL